MEKMVEIVCTMEQLLTIKTALLMERERNRDKPYESELIESAREAVSNWKWRN